MSWAAGSGAVKTVVGSKPLVVLNARGPDPLLLCLLLRDRCLPHPSCNTIIAECWLHPYVHEMGWTMGQALEEGFALILNLSFPGGPSS